jgi:hypothetical protein
MELRQKEPREKNERYLNYIRATPCLICNGKAEAAHIRTGNLDAGKRETGGGETSSDKWALPLCRTHHVEQHDAGREILFWNSYGLDPFAAAMRFWEAWKKINEASANGRSQRQRSSAPSQSRPAKSMRTVQRKSMGGLSSKRSAWPKRHGTMKSRNSFGRQERT